MQLGAIGLLPLQRFEVDALGGKVALDAGEIARDERFVAIFLELLALRGLELLEMGETEACCGFGGTFAVKYPQISTAMAEVKCNSILETQADYVVSNDSSCLMQIQGWFDRNCGKTIKSLHIAEVLASR